MSTALPSRTLWAGPTRPGGLDDAEVAFRLARDGPNRLPPPTRTSPAVELLRQMTHFFAVMLWVAAALAVVAGMPQLGVAIAVVVVVNGVFAFAQEYRADRAAERLRDLLPVRVTVVRSGRRRSIPADGLVAGDLVLLEGGDRVCADLVLQHAVHLAVDASMLTGESVPVHPGPGELAYAGTFVVEGEAFGEVVATGPRTRLAAIASLTWGARRPRSPLAVRLSRVVLVVGVVAVVVGAAFFGLALLLGSPASEGFLFAIGVTVALVPEGLLPTVTLSLARGAQRMADQHALVRRLDAVETLGSTTFICSDKTGTLTRNQMSVVAVWTPSGSATVRGSGYAPEGEVSGEAAVLDAVRALARSAVRCSTGRVHATDGGWTPFGDPMEVALHVLALRCGVDVVGDERHHPETRRLPFDPRRRRTSSVAGHVLHVKGAPEVVLPLCPASEGADEAVHALAGRGLRVLAVARRDVTVDQADHASTSDLERGLELLGLVGIEDPPREGVEDAIASCRSAGVRLAMVTGDHPATARAIAREVGLLGADELVVEGAELPEDETALGALLDHDGVVVARVTPEQKLAIARALRARGHVVAMTGDGVNDAPALREADIGIAMGLSGTDVAREAADLVLLDDHIATVVAAVALGRATFLNTRRFLTYHLTDNVAELTPFVVWALTSGNVPLAIGVLQVLALDIGTDLLPALALGAEPPSARVMAQPPPTGQLIDRYLLRRVFLVLGPVEAVVEMLAFLAVLLAAGWAFGETPPASVYAAASGAAFAAVVLGQLANAFACRSTVRPAWRVPLLANRLLLVAVVVEIGLLLGFLAVPPVADLLGGTLPTALGWALAVLAVPAVLLADAADKRVLARLRRRVPR